MAYTDVKAYWRGLLAEYTKLLDWKVEKHPDTREIAAANHKVVDKSE